MIYGSDEFNDTLVRIIRTKYRHPYYETAVAIAKAMSVHVYGDKPVSLLERVRPGEDDVIKKYRLDNYEPTTKAPCGKAIKIVSKIFNPNLSSIIFPSENEKAEKLKQYTMYYYPVYNSLTSFNKDVTLKKMIADANALMVVKPSKRPQNDAERVKPVVIIYSSENLWYWDHEHYLVFLSEDKVNNETVYTFEYYDYQQIIKFKVTSPKEDTLEFEDIPDESYQHNFRNKEGEPQIPAWKLGGNSIPLPDGEIVYESFFADAQAHWNLSIIHQSDIQGSFTKHMNPQRMVIGDECTHQETIEGFQFKCNHGILRSPSTKDFYTCSECDGSGKVSSSPYVDNIILKSKLDEIGNLGMSPVEYVKVPVDATKLLVEQAKDMVREGSAAINMFVEDQVGANQSGVAKVMDRSAQNNTIYDIGSQMYDVHFQNQFYFINKYLNGTEDSSAGKRTDDNLPQINKPTTFNIESIGELIEGFKASAESGLDRNFLQAKEVEILSRNLETNPALKLYYSTLIDLDPLFHMPIDEIEMNLAKGLIYKTDAAIHSNLKPFFDRAISENKNFITATTKEEKLAKLREYAEELIESEEPKLDLTFDTAPISTGD